MKLFLWSLRVVVCLFLLFFLIFSTTGLPARQTEKDHNSWLNLVKPAFAQDYGSFPGDEAGISAYVKVGNDLDLNKVKSGLRGTRAEGDGYVIGIVELSGMSADNFPQLFASSNGWIVAYYSKYNPTSRIMQWISYDKTTITTNNLRDAILKICNTCGISSSNIKSNIAYYHFGFPNASHVILAAKVLERGRNTMFSYSIPSDVTPYEVSLASYGLVEAQRIIIDDTIAHKFSNDPKIFVETITNSVFLVPDKSHQITVPPSYYLVDQPYEGLSMAFVY
jgi:hypothetical protein